MLTRSAALFRPRQQAAPVSPRHEKKKPRAYTLHALMEDLQYGDFSVFKLDMMLAAISWDGSRITLQGSTFCLLPALLEQKAFDAFEVLIRHAQVCQADCNQALLQICALAGKKEEPQQRMYALAHLLLDYGASCEATDATTGRTALHVAYHAGAPLDFLSLLALHANVNVICHATGQAVLHRALVDNQVDLVRMLLRNGANVNLPDEQGQVPLVLAARHGTTDASLRLLLRFGATAPEHLNGNDDDVEYLLKSPTVALQLLQQGGIDIMAHSDKHGATLLHTMFGDWCTWATSVSPSQLQGLLFPHHPQQDSKASSLLHAILANVTDNNINVQDTDGRTPLHYACAVRHPATAAYCRALIVDGLADVDTRDNIHGWTPLHVAAAAGNYAVALALIQLGASVEAVDALGRTPWHLLDQQVVVRGDNVAFKADAADDKVSVMTALVHESLRHGFDFLKRDNQGNLPFFSVTNDTLHFAMMQAAASQGLFR